MRCGRPANRHRLRRRFARVNYFETYCSVMRADASAAWTESSGPAYSVPRPLRRAIVGAMADATQSRSRVTPPQPGPSPKLRLAEAV